MGARASPTERQSRLESDLAVWSDMVVSLTPEQEAWIAAHVAAGDFASVDDAARQLIDERIAELDVENDALAWAKRHVEEARTAVKRGAFITLDEHRARNTKRLAAHKT